MAARHATDAGGQLQPLVRQPPTPRDETARSARHLDLELGRPEARRAFAHREAGRKRRAGASPALPRTTLRAAPTRAGGEPRTPRSPGRRSHGTLALNEPPSPCGAEVPGRGTALPAPHTARMETRTGGATCTTGTT
jgi:hypothetical protein